MLVICAVFLKKRYIHKCFQFKLVNVRIYVELNNGFQYENFMKTPTHINTEIL